MNYPRYQDCRRIVRFGEGSSVRVEFFDEFHVGDQGSCYFDFVDIRDGENEESPSIMKLCGNKKPQVTYSQGRSLWIRFKSGYAGYKGFSLQVTQVDPPERKK